MAIKASGVKTFEGGDFEARDMKPAPDVKPGEYHATIVGQIDEPIPGKQFDPGEEPPERAFIVWELDGHPDTELVQWFNIPAGISKSPPELHSKSTIYKIMEAIGYDMEGPYDINSDDWIGETAYIYLQPKESDADILVVKGLREDSEWREEQKKGAQNKGTKKF